MVSFGGLSVNILCCLCALGLSHGRPVEVEPVGVVDAAVENGVRI